MRSGEGLPRRRRRVPDVDAAPSAALPQPALDEARERTFTCSRCFRNLPWADRSRVRLGRCRACV